MTERHGGQMALRTTGATADRRIIRGAQRLVWRETRNGVPPSRHYEWNGYPDLSAIRQAAAARCGLSEYPAELIELSESLDRNWERLPRPERERLAKRYRRLALAAQREQAGEGGAA